MKSENVSPAKSNKNYNNGQLIEQILAQTKAQLLKVKTEQSSDESSTTPTTKSKKRTPVKKESLISELVSRELEGLSKKRKRTSKDLNSSDAAPKKSKVDKSNEVSEDEKKLSAEEKNKCVNNLNTNGSPLYTTKEIKQEKDDRPRSLSQERNELEKLFSSSKTSIANSTLNPSQKSPKITLTDLSISRILKHDNVHSSSENEMSIPTPKKQKSPVIVDATPMLKEVKVLATNKSVSTPIKKLHSGTESSSEELTVPKPLQVKGNKKKTRTKHTCIMNELFKASLPSASKKRSLSVQKSASSIEKQKSSTRKKQVPAPAKASHSTDSVICSEEDKPSAGIRRKFSSKDSELEAAIPQSKHNQGRSTGEASGSEKSRSANFTGLYKSRSIKEKQLLNTKDVSDDGSADADANSNRSIKNRSSSAVVNKKHSKASPRSRKSLEIANRNGEESSSSNDEVPVPKPIILKSESVSLGNKKDSRASSVSRKSSVTANRSDEESSSSNDEVPVPKPVIFKSESVSLGNKKDSKAASVSRKSSVTANRNGEESSSSNDEVPVPKAIILKSEPVSLGNKKGSKTSPDSRKSLVTANRSDEESSSNNDEVPVPKAIILKSEPVSLGNKKYSKASPDSRKSLVTANRSDEESSSSNDEVPVPKAIILKSESVSLGNKKHSKASPDSRKSLVTANRSDEESSSSNDEVPVPKAIILKSEPVSLGNKKYSKASPRSRKSPVTVNRNDEESSSSNDEVPVPKPIILKSESVSLGNKKDSKASPVSRKSSVTVNRNDEESSSSNDEVPVPKPIKSDPVSLAKAKRQHIKSKSSLKRDVVPLDKRSKEESSSDESSSADLKPAQNDSVSSILKSHVSSLLVADQDHEETTVPRPRDAKLKRPGKQIASIESSQLPDKSNDLEQGSPTKISIPHKMSWIEELTANFPGIQQHQIETSLPENNAKYSLLLIPKHINPSSLINLKCHFNKETPISLNNVDYVFQPLPKKPDPVIISFNTTKLVELQSVVNLQQFVPELRLNEVKVPVRERISLPSEIKSRHPLFGANYKKQIRLDKGIKRQLQEAFERKEKVLKKELRKRKTKRKSTSVGVEENVLSIFNSIPTTGDNAADMEQIFRVKVEDGSFTKESTSNSNTEKSNIHVNINRKHKALQAATEEVSYTDWSDVVGGKKKKKRKIADVVHQ